jgi:glutathione synthase/RimK-type ligase-like ATP-grasp enzyme
MSDGMRLALVALRSTPTNVSLAHADVGGRRWEEMTPEVALARLRPGDAALGRLDVLPTIDGIDDGMWALGALQAGGVVVLNDASAVYATHDKLLTARLLRRTSLPHPRTVHVRSDRPFAAVRPPVVVKPRFGSGGRAVTWCEDENALVETLSSLSTTSWFEQQGVLVQELVPPQGYDLRILVAAGRVVGAIFRIAADGEWRTNVALGGLRRPVSGSPACRVRARAGGCTRGGCGARRSRSRPGRFRQLDDHRAKRRGGVHLGVQDRRRCLRVHCIGACPQCRSRPRDRVP